MQQWCIKGSALEMNSSSVDRHATLHDQYRASAYLNSAIKILLLSYIHDVPGGIKGIGD